MILFRHADARFPFLFDTPRQRDGRWNRENEGPVQYLADTAYGAWAEYLRHEEITDPADLAGLARALWAVDVDLNTEQVLEPTLHPAVTLGDESTYPACQDEAERLALAGATALKVASAALLPGLAAGHRTSGDRLVDGPGRDGMAYVLFGPRPDVIGWLVVEAGSPPAEVLPRVRHL